MKPIKPWYEEEIKFSDEEEGVPIHELIMMRIMMDLFTTKS